MQTLTQLGFQYVINYKKKQIYKYVHLERTKEELFTFFLGYIVFIQEYYLVDHRGR